VAKSGGESTLTVLLAMGANLAVGIAKLVAGLLTGSAAMLSEAAHSVGDTMTEVLLLTALRRSLRPADRRHPFGYGKERYVFSLLAAVSIFVAGALFSVYQGVHTLLGPPEERQEVLVALIVLVVAAVIEGVSLTQAVRQVHRERSEQELGVRDSAAITGLAIAFAGVGLTALTGSPVWDGLASLLIGGLLAGAAYALARTNMALLIGRQADPRLVAAIGHRLREQPEVEAVVDLLTMLTGTDQVLVCARIDFVPDATSDDIEHACVRIDADLRAEFGDLDEVFLEPVPRGDPELRERVRARYGRTIEDLPDGADPAPENAGDLPGTAAGVTARQ
jgi:cation diffusion facilitator family transporter